MQCPCGLFLRNQSHARGVRGTLVHFGVMRPYDPLSYISPQTTTLLVCRCGRGRGCGCGCGCGRRPKHSANDDGRLWRFRFRF